MEEKGEQAENLPFELSQISKPARNYLKILAAGLLQYRKDLPAGDPEVFPPGQDNGDCVHEGASGQERR
jgi:hypothetical protein